MKMVRCGGCKKYIERSKAIRRGLQNFCGRSCMSRLQWRKKKPDVPGELRMQVFEDDSFTCRGCGSRYHHLHIHHIIYRSQGGQHEYDNLITLCHRCHDVVHDSPRSVYEPILQEIVALRKAGDRKTRVLDLIRKRN